MKLAWIVLLLVTVVACGKPVPADAAAQTHAPVVMPAPPPVRTIPALPAELHGFAPDAVLAVRLHEINAAGYPMVWMRNLTGRDIEGIRGAFELRDAAGELLHTTGLTIDVPGQTFVAADAEVENSPFGLNRRDELMQRLRDAPDELSFSFVAQHVAFVDEP